MDNSKTITLLEKLLSDAKEKNVEITIVKKARYEYYIKFKQPWHIQEITAYCEEALLKDYMC